MRKENGFKIYILLALITMIYSCQQTEDNKLSFANYDNLKLGFTTQNFINAITPSETSAKLFIDYAFENGYSWIELRDPDAELTFDECKYIAQYADLKNIEIAYCNQRSFLDTDFFKIFQKGVKNATAFKKGPKTIRALISGDLFNENPGKVALTKDEFDRLVAIAKKAAKIAKENGLTLVVENGAELIYTDGESYGTQAFLDATDELVYLQPDVGNPFSGDKKHLTNEELQKFISDNISKIKYLHLKSAIDGNPLPYLDKYAMDYDQLFSTMSANEATYITIELHALDNEDEVYNNQKRSIEFLKASGYIN